jgi:uncharacterized membrane protein YfcA
MNDILLIAGAGLVAGTMNAIAGGGSFVTLPALMAAGVPALNANASSTVALVPSALASAYAYRHDFQGFDGVSFRVMAVLSVLGGVCGAILLLVTPQSVFAFLVPFLLLFGTLAFAFGRQAGAWLRERIHITPHMMLVCQFILGVYGGYFGGAVGIMMLAAWSLLTSSSLAAMQPARHLLNSAMNTVASLLFIAGGLVLWRQTFILFVGAIIGGYFGAHYGRRIDPVKARIVISCLNACMTALVFWRVFGP